MITASTIDNETLNVSSASSSRSLETWSIEVDGSDVPDIGRQRDWPFFGMEKEGTTSHTFVNVCLHHAHTHFNTLYCLGEHSVYNL